MKKIIEAFFALVVVAACSPAPPKQASDARLYVLDCGDITMDMSAFSRNREFVGEVGELANPCFLIRHPDGDLIWDTGFEESLVDNLQGIDVPGFQAKMKRRLTEQLAELDLSPADIDYVALSHSHPDHAGNANLFAQSVFLAQEQEYASMFSAERRKDTSQFPFFEKLETARKQFFKDRLDVFGDGTVVIHHMPGHTPGHAVLLVRLENAGVKLLTGDLYIQEKGRDIRAVAYFNLNQDQTLASMDRFEKMANDENAQVIIQHDRLSLGQLPAFPGFLD